MHVVCLIGTSRCGSTVLQAALAQFQDVTALGEVKRLSTLAARGALCGCGAKINDCEIWGPHIADFVAPTGGRLRMLGNALAIAAGAPLFPADARAAQSLSRMLHAIDRQKPSRVFVDSSKRPRPASALCGASGHHGGPGSCGARPARRRAFRRPAHRHDRRRDGTALAPAERRDADPSKNDTAPAVADHSL